MEELAYALHRALSNRGSGYPFIGILPGSIDLSLLPASIRTRLYVSLTDQNWIERIKAALEERPVDVFKPELMPFTVDQVTYLTAGS